MKVGHTAESPNHMQYVHTCLRITHAELEHSKQFRERASAQRNVLPHHNTKIICQFHCLLIFSSHRSVAQSRDHRAPPNALCVNVHVVQDVLQCTRFFVDCSACALCLCVSWFLSFESFSLVERLDVFTFGQRSQHKYADKQ